MEASSGTHLTRDLLEFFLRWLPRAPAFASEALGETTSSWLQSVGLSYGADLHDVIPLGQVRLALERDFREIAAEPTAYLARELGREDLHQAELEAIDAGELAPTGFRLVYERR